jgi:hypothetical protein
MKKLCVLGFLLVSTSAMALSPAFVFDVSLDGGYNSNGSHGQMGGDLSLGVGLEKWTIYLGAFGSFDPLLLGGIHTDAEGTVKYGPKFGFSWNPIGRLTLFADFGWQWEKFKVIHYTKNGTEMRQVRSEWVPGEYVYGEWVPGEWKYEEREVPKYDRDVQTSDEFYGPVLRTGISYLFDT